jgi:hypothetical protein
MPGTPEPAKLTAAPRRPIGANAIALVALAVIAGMAAGAVLVYTPVADDLLIFLGFTHPKDCG